MTNIVPVQQMLGLPLTADVSQIIDAIRELQKATDIQKRRADAMEEAWNEARARLNRAENPEFWRATFTGDSHTAGTFFTSLTHGNLVTIEGTGQVLMHFHPCCQNLSCACTRLDNEGHCNCHKIDE